MGADNSFDLRVVQYPDQPINELSIYVVTTRFMCILALQDYFGDQTAKTMVWDAPFDKVELSLTLINRVAAGGIMRADVIFALQQAIAGMAEYGFFHTEFAFVKGQITWATLIFESHDPTTSLDASTIDASRQDN